MKVGVIFPQTELGGDVGAVRTYAEAADGLHFDHLLAYDHVVGADPAIHQGWAGPYDVTTTFHEPFVLFGFLAAITSLELVTGIIILPQRQTVLVAKQAAEVDLLTGGRFRLGIGVGWNPVEYEALGRPFGDRGRRVPEQVELLRRLWTEASVTHEGPTEQIHGAGLAPLPIQRPIPIWMGGNADATFERIGRFADGWFPRIPPGEGLDHALEVIASAAVEAGRDPATIGMEGRVTWRRDDPDTSVRQVEKWRAAGASHVTLDTMYTGNASVEDHLASLATAADALIHP